ncbi:MAG: bifunctional phosphopantothenoylcysteine decarboxylase/phosphopantothenate--cysteine ligase CoaBC [Tannerella sp.]|jgi:phosphopantothenoylcysteine decarboxylase/phosphopantothenate--cysteine ligase|nr:bifunctional phosphopantothenoylcysteine decarboxylase/phosphopantothenate--cysteine ligase CoaBC [Tannerella sp.]
MLRGKNIVLGITGSIAAYKAAYLIRAFVKKGAEVKVVITPAGKEFVTPLTLATLSNNPVISDFFSNRDGTWNSHVDLGLWADVMLIAPASASTVGKMANGIADNMLITTYLSCKAPVFVAPAMDLDMYAHPSTQQNLDKLRSYGNHIIEPATGFLASGLEGKGRMPEPDDIVKVLEDFFSYRGELQKKKILITAGPTYEKIDPVRFIGNYSSGKMGFALAEACAGRGAEVALISGPVSLKTTHPSIERIDVESADEMYNAAVRIFPSCDIAILCAAVADYKPEQRVPEKIKRECNEAMSISLVRNKDIAATLGKDKRTDQMLVGFALETKNGLTNAKEKLQRKNFDVIVLNSLSDEGAGFGYDTNKVMLIDKYGRETELPLQSKTEVAEKIIDYLVGMCMQMQPVDDDALVT